MADSGWMSESDDEAKNMREAVEKLTEKLEDSVNRLSKQSKKIQDTIKVQVKVEILKYREAYDESILTCLRLVGTMIKFLKENDVVDKEYIDSIGHEMGDLARQIMLIFKRLGK